MALLFRDIVLNLDQDESDLPRVTADLLGLQPEQLADFKIVRRTIDARKKPRIKRVFSVSFSAPDERALLQRFPGLQRQSQPVATQPGVTMPRSYHAMVVGMGPAGLFAALRLAQSGVRVTSGLYPS